MSEVTPPAVIATISHTPNDTHASQTAGSLDVDVLSRTISAAVTETLQAALSGDNLAAILKNSVPDSSNPVLPSVKDEVRAITGDNGLSGIGGVPANAGLDDLQLQQIFTSIAVGPPGLALNLKAKYGRTNLSTLGHYYFQPLKMKADIHYSPSAGPQRTPQLTLEPSPSNKKITSIHQWASAFNIFVSVYAERFSSETPRLMKYCEVVRDLAFKSGDWFLYDEQFR